tara:strand:- start:1399 stop:1794 length:396 start_codon:yes stop_codon:yes gene_type:complete
MKNIKTEMLTEMTVENVIDQFHLLDEDDFEKSGVYKIDVGCRGEIDDLEMVCDTDTQSEFSVKTEEEILKEITEGIDKDDFDDESEYEAEKEFAKEFVASEFETLENFDVYMEGYYEESNTYYVKVKVDGK